MKNYDEKWYSNWKTLLLILSLFKTLETKNSSLKIQPETDDFKNLLTTNSLYVDKTNLIEKYLNLLAQDDTALLIVQRPEGWAKTTNMKMLQTFLEIEVDDKGFPLPKYQTINDDLFLGGSINGTRLDPLKISNSTIALKHLGQHPVIFLQLKKTNGNSYEEIISGIKSRTMEVYKKHEYLLESSSLKIKDKFKLKDYLDGEFDETDLITSIHFLSEKLYEHFGRKVHIFIDDYDIPFVFASINNYTVDYTKIETLLRNMLENTISKNKFRSIALMNGVYPVNVSYVKWHCNYYLADSSILEYYGFTQTEVEKLFQDSKIEMDHKEFKNWYGGYYLNEKSDHYSARSVMRCLARNGTIAYYGPTLTLDTCEIENLDYDYEYIDQTTNYCNQSDNMFILSTGKILLKNVRNIFHILTTSNFKTSQCSCSNSSFEDYSIDGSSSEEYLYLMEKTMLFYNGFLTTDEIFKPISSTGWSGSSQITSEELLFLQYLHLRYSPYLIPNNEITYFYQTIALQWICHMFEMNEVEFFSFVQLILDHRMLQFMEIFRDRIRKSRVTDYLKSEGTKSQLELYNAFVMSLKLALSMSHTIKYQDDDTNDNDRMAPCDLSAYGHRMIFIPKTARSDVLVSFKFEIVDEDKYEIYFNRIISESEISLKATALYNPTVSTLQKNLNIDKHIKISLAFCGQNIAMKYIVKLPQKVYSGAHMPKSMKSYGIVKTNQGHKIIDRRPINVKDPRESSEFREY